jgi:hypothetical protein
MRVQALEVAKDEGKSTRWGLRLLEKELAIHQPAYVPGTRAERKLNKGMVNDAIAKVVSIGRNDP